MLTGKILYGHFADNIKNWTLNMVERWLYCFVGIPCPSKKKNNIALFKSIPRFSPGFEKISRILGQLWDE